MSWCPPIPRIRLCMHARERRTEVVESCTQKLVKIMHFSILLVTNFIDCWSDFIVSVVMAYDAPEEDDQSRRDASSSWTREIFTGLRPMYLIMQAAAVVGILIMFWYVGRPGYWEAVLHHYSGDQIVLVEPREMTANDYTNIQAEVQDSPKNETSDSKMSSVNNLVKFSAYQLLKRPVWDPPPDGSQMPPREAFALQKDMLEFHAKKNVVAVTFGNHAFMDFILTWVKSLTSVGVTNVLVGAMDETILEALFWKGVPVFDLQSETPTQDLGWGTHAFHKLGREKAYLIEKILQLGYELLLCDSDVIWFKNPLPYFERHPHADLLTSTDLLVPTVEDDSLEKWESALHASLNIGYFIWRPSPAAKKLVSDWTKELIKNPNTWDQGVLNEMVHRKLGPAVENDPSLFYAYNGSVKIGILPTSIFCNGHTYFVQALYRQLGLEPYATHTTFQFSGTEGKRHRLREACVFEDKAEYYNTPGGFMSFDPAIPEELKTGNRTLHSHFALINYQLVQIRDALAIASILNRTLIMPPMWCRYDRFWFPHPGIIPGTRLAESFVCPMDHVLEVNSFLADMPETEFGPKIGIREYSFQSNPRLLNEVKTSYIKVEICSNTTDEKCNATTSSALPLARNLTADNLKEALSAYKDVKVLEFSSMRNVFGGFTDKIREAKFEKRVKRSTSIWCCVDKKIGHIYYDMYWDRKPNWKPVPPSGPEEDHPPWD